MSITKIIVLSITGLIIFSGVMYWISTSNTEIDLRSEFVASEKARQTTLDGMWKKISQKFQITKEYEKTWKDAIELSVQGRDGGEVFKMVTEAYPNLSTELFKEVMATIDGERDKLKASQDKLADIQREHNNMLDKFPSSLIVGGRERVVFTLVTSTNTQKMLTTGKEDDIELK